MKTLQALTLTIVAVFAPTKDVVLTVMALTMVDMFTGILASHKRGEPLTSNKLKRTVLKTAVYEVAALSAFLVGQYLTGPDMPVMNMVTTLIGLVELKSILENVEAINGTPVFKGLINKLANLTDPKDKE